MTSIRVRARSLAAVGAVCVVSLTLAGCSGDKDHKEPAPIATVQVPADGPSSAPPGPDTGDELTRDVPEAAIPEYTTATELFDTAEAAPMGVEGIICPSWTSSYPRVCLPESPDGYPSSGQTLAAGARLAEFIKTTWTVENSANPDDILMDALTDFATEELATAVTNTPNVLGGTGWEESVEVDPRLRLIGPDLNSVYVVVDPEGAHDTNTVTFVASFDIRMLNATGTHDNWLMEQFGDDMSFVATMVQDADEVWRIAALPDLELGGILVPRQILG